MTTSILKEYISMHGYGVFVWPAYGCVIAFMISQWFGSYKRWKKFYRTYNKQS